MSPQTDGDPASLSRLHDIELPAAVSLWPTQPGWWLVLAAAGVLAATLAWAWWGRRRATAYRREALRELAELRSRRAGQPLPALLKRVAIAAHPRREVAALSGRAWLEFLDRTGGGGAFASGAGTLLEQLAYRGGEVTDEDALFAAAERWIRAQGPAR